MERYTAFINCALCNTQPVYDPKQACLRVKCETPGCLGGAGWFEAEEWNGLHIRVLEILRVNDDWIVDARGLLERLRGGGSNDDENQEIEELLERRE